ncbi:MAG: uncharacterized protein JWN35_1760 [Frankiales bacterium]|jgi:uncharacterized protein YkwD|nr:uncharacterized protein [Frankiales bacterium]
MRPFRLLTMSSLATLSVLAGLLAAGAPAAQAAPPAAAPTLTPQAYAARVAVLVNQQRARAKLRPLTVSACATRFAGAWSARMAKTGAFDHQSLRPIMTGCKARGAGENIAYGSVTPDQMMAMWMRSPGHKANILRPSYTHLGVGVARSGANRWYGTQDFLSL